MACWDPSEQGFYFHQLWELRAHFRVWHIARTLEIYLMYGWMNGLQTRHPHLGDKVFVGQNPTHLFFTTSACLSQRRQWQPTLVLLPGKSHGQRSLVGCSPWGLEDSDMTERHHFHFSLSCIGEGNGNPLQCSCLENPRDGGAWWAAVYGVSQSQTWLKQLSSSSSKVVCYSCLFKNFPVCCDPQSQRLLCSQWRRSRCFSGIPLLFLWSNGCWQFDLWFLCLF